jgi:hypothetical protein
MMDGISTCDELGCLNRWQEKWKSMTVPTKTSTGERCVLLNRRNAELYLNMDDVLLRQILQIPTRFCKIVDIWIL